MNVKLKLNTKTTIADDLPNSLVALSWFKSINKWRKPAMKCCKYAQIKAKAINLKNHPGTEPTPALKTEVNLVNEISELTEVSNIQMMNGISKNMIAPLARCKIDTQAAGAMR